MFTVKKRIGRKREKKADKQTNAEFEADTSLEKLKTAVIAN